MTAIQEAKKLYEERGIRFEDRLGAYLANGGVVVSTPERFLMARMINSERGDADWNPEDADCWYCECAVGRGGVEWFLLQAPIRMPKIAFRRFKDKQERLKCYNTSTFERYA